MTRPIDTTEISRLCTEKWFAQTLTSLRGVNLKFRMVRETAADFHVHPDSAECFYVLAGQVEIDVESQTHVLGPGQFLHIPAGVRHRSRVKGTAELLVLDELAP